MKYPLEVISCHSCPQERNMPTHITEMNSKHNQLLRSPFQRSIFLTPFKGKKKKIERTQMAKDKMLVSQIITGQMLIKMTIRNQIPSNRMAILTVCQQYTEERARR